MVCSSSSAAIGIWARPERTDVISARSPSLSVPVNSGTAEGRKRTISVFCVDGRFKVRLAALVLRGIEDCRWQVKTDGQSIVAGLPVGDDSLGRE